MDTGRTYVQFLNWHISLFLLLHPFKFLTRVYADFLLPPSVKRQTTNGKHARKIRLQETYRELRGVLCSCHTIKRMPRILVQGHKQNIMQKGKKDLYLLINIGSWVSISLFTSPLRQTNGRHERACCSHCLLQTVTWYLPTVLQQNFE